MACAEQMPGASGSSEMKLRSPQDPARLMRPSHALKPARNGCTTAREVKLNISLQSTWASKGVRGVRSPAMARFCVGDGDGETATANLFPPRAQPHASRGFLHSDALAHRGESQSGGGWNAPARRCRYYIHMSVHACADRIQQEWK